MLEILTFIFSNFWIWVGTLLLLEVVVEGIVNVFRPQRVISETQLKEILRKNPEEK